MKESNVFETSNVDFATFLVYEGIKLLEYKLQTIPRNVVTMRFLDERQNCLDLERIFLNSDMKRYREINKYLLKKIHEVIRNG